VREPADIAESDELASIRPPASASASSWRLSGSRDHECGRGPAGPSSA
jgi:hypothetical protein